MEGRPVAGERLPQGFARTTDYSGFWQSPGGDIAIRFFSFFWFVGSTALGYDEGSFCAV